MKTIGFIGGMSWESSLEYYRLANEMVKEKLGEPHSARIVMYSVDFAEFKQLQHNDNWDQLTARMINIAGKLEKAGAEMIVICANTMHLMAENIEQKTNIPLIHIADAAAEAIKADKITTAGLLGTRFTMEKDFYKQRLEDKFNIEVVTPKLQSRKIIHEIIYEELISGVIRDKSRDKLKKIIAELRRNKNTEGIILGCTELPMLTGEMEPGIPLYDTTRLHVKKAVNLALKE